MVRIMVVDDNATARRFVSACFKQTAHAVEEVEPTCLHEVLSRLHQEPPALLVLDWMMPDCPGQTLIRVCREDAHLKDLKILLLTAHGDLNLARWIEAMGNIHYLGKPVAPQTLVECVDTFLGGHLLLDSGWTLAGRGLVAIVDDSQLSRVYHSTCFRKQGFQTLEVDPRSLSTTLQTLEEAAPQLIVLDYLMPHFQGDALVRAIRARPEGSFRDTPVLLVTAHQSPELATVLGKLGGVEVLQKPATPADLLARTKSILGLKDDGRPA